MTITTPTSEVVIPFQTKGFYNTFKMCKLLLFFWHSRLSLLAYIALCYIDIQALLHFFSQMELSPKSKYGHFGIIMHAIY